MNRLFDALLPRPLTGALYHPLEFIFFVIHFFFVLITVGSAFYALLALYRRRREDAALPADPEEGRAGSSQMPVYFASKSLMITFGIAVLLLVMAYYSVPFTGAANLNGGVWLGMIALLSAALIVLEVSDRRARRPGAVKGFWAGLAGLALLLAVPGIFVAFVVTAENPGQWALIFRRGLLNTSLAGHWLARLLHVYGAAVVIAGMFYVIYSSRTGRKSPATPAVLFSALMAQIVIGILLYMSMPARPGAYVNLFVLTGAAAAGWFAWLMFSGRMLQGGRYRLPAALALILIPMLLARQLHQENALAPFHALLEKNAGELKAAAAKAAPAGNPFLEEKYDAYNLPQFIFQRSCAFCHGGVGNGQGREAGLLKVPPADLTQIRTDRPYLIGEVLEKGVPGSGMPYFSVYTGSALKGLADYLYRQVGMRETPEPVPVATAPAEEEEAALVYSRQCASCHGTDGRPGAKAKALAPPPRDMTRWALSPAASFRAITEGIAGTSMKGFGRLPERLRWALVERMNGFYRQKKKKAEKGQ